MHLEYVYKSDSDNCFTSQYQIHDKITNKQ